MRASDLTRSRTEASVAADGTRLAGAEEFTTGRFLVDLANRDTSDVATFFRKAVDAKVAVSSDFKEKFDESQLGDANAYVFESAASGAEAYRWTSGGGMMGLGT